MLARLPPEQIGLVLTHPFQTSTIDVLVQLLSELRSLSTFVECYEFQRKLFGAVFEADTRRSRARRQERRAAAGKPVEECATGSWALESLVCDRVARQARLVGDALAWRLFNFDRRVVMALSRNDPAGPMTNKAGLEREIGEVQHAWETEGVFALLHDLTNCLRIADVTRFTSEMPLLVEVKNDPARVGGRQLARMKHAVDVINDGAPLVADDVETELLQSSQQIRTRVRDLPPAFARASRDAQAVLRLGSGWMVVCRDLTSPALGVADIEARIAELDSKRQMAFAKAGMAEQGQHHLRGEAIDRVGKAPALAPVTIFPLDERTCALLACDLLTFEVVLTWDRLASEFGALGYETRCLLPEEGGRRDRDSLVLEASRRDTGFRLSAAGLDQLLFEILEPRVFAAAIDGFCRTGRNVPSAVFTFRNERAVWR